MMVVRLHPRQPTSALTFELLAVCWLLCLPSCWQLVEPWLPAFALPLVDFSDVLPMLPPELGIWQRLQCLALLHFHGLLLDEISRQHHQTNVVAVLVAVVV